MISGFILTNVHWSNVPINFLELSKNSKQYVKTSPTNQKYNKNIYSSNESLSAIVELSPTTPISPPSGNQITTHVEMDSNGTHTLTLEEANSLKIQGENQLSNINSLNDFYNLLSNYTGKIILDGSRNLVVKDGEYYNKLMILGEAPGAEEDLQGRPFVGRSGILLNNLLQRVGIIRENVYITNVAYWRPLKNRTPTKIEIDVLRPFLMKHVELHKPKLILALGTVAASGILNYPNKPLNTLRGTVHYITSNGVKIPVIVSFHPSFLLRFQSTQKISPQIEEENKRDFMKDAQKDMAAVKKLWDQLN